MRILADIIGILVIVLVAQDAFETVVLPRRIARRIRISRFFFITTWSVWKFIAGRIRSGAVRETALSSFGPLSLLVLIALWAILFVFGFGLLMWGLKLSLNVQDHTISILTYLYLSGTTFFTLGLGDITPNSGPARVFLVIEVASGFGFLALVISYVPVLYQVFSRREQRISLLDARAGSPATATEFLCRNCSSQRFDELRTLLHEWEVWCADILESHLSYPVLGYYRSQHNQQSWIEALTVILDTCALILAGIEDIPVEPARFAFAISRHAVVDLAQVFDLTFTPGVNRLPTSEFIRVQEVLAASGIFLKGGMDAEQTLTDLRETYEPFVTALARYMQVSLPPWVADKDALDDWQSSAWDERMPSAHRTLLKVMLRV